MLNGIVQVVCQRCKADVAEMEYEEYKEYREWLSKIKLPVYCFDCERVAVVAIYGPYAVNALESLAHELPPPSNRGVNPLSSQPHAPEKGQNGLADDLAAAIRQVTDMRQAASKALTRTAGLEMIERATDHVRNISATIDLIDDASSMKETALLVSEFSELLDELDEQVNSAHAVIRHRIREELHSDNN